TAQVQNQVGQVVDKRIEFADLVIDGKRDHRQGHIHVLHRSREVMDEIRRVDLPNIRIVDNRFGVVEIDKAVCERVGIDQTRQQQNPHKQPYLPAKTGLLRSFRNLVAYFSFLE